MKLGMSLKTTKTEETNQRLYRDLYSSRIKKFTEYNKPKSILSIESILKGAFKTRYYYITEWH